MADYHYAEKNTWQLKDRGRRVAVGGVESDGEKRREEKRREEKRRGNRNYRLEETVQRTHRKTGSIIHETSSVFVFHSS